MKIVIAKLKKPARSRKPDRIRGEPRPFKPAKPPKREPPRSPPIHEPARVGPDTIRQRTKEARLREILESANIHNQQLFNQLIRWEQS